MRRKMSGLLIEIVGMMKTMSWRQRGKRNPRQQANKKVLLQYRDEQGRDTRRTIWPIAVGYLETVRHLAGWCELRKDFRSFRIDRIAQAVFLDEKYPERRTALRVKWMKSMHENRMRERGYHDNKR